MAKSNCRGPISRALARVAAPVVTVLALFCASACSGPRLLMPTPNLYTVAPEDPFADVPPSRRTTTIDLLYLTDRAPEETKDGSLTYGWHRSPSLAYGSCLVEIGHGLTWDELVEQSRIAKRTKSVALTIAEIAEHGRLDPTPTPMVLAEGKLVEAPEAIAQREGVAKAFSAELDKRLAETSRKEVYIFVHGYKNTFDQSAYALAELWHFLGREGVAILYSWPAGSPGLLRGYTHDRESGEFTIYHLKQAFRGIAAHPGIERLHIIAHSRGTDVCASALRELFIEARSKGEDPLTKYRADLLLAAPDLDSEVVGQRFSAERFGQSLGRLTVYVSENDKALGIADWLLWDPLESTCRHASLSIL